MSLVIEHIKKYQDQIAMVSDDQALTYNEFLDQVTHLQTKLSAHFDTNSRYIIALKAEPTLRYFIRLMALIELGQIVAPYIVLEDLSEVDYDMIYEEELKSIHAKPSQTFDFEGAGIILLSTGMTGKSKVVLHQFEPLAKKYIKLKTPFSSVLVFSPEHISGIETWLSIIMPGGTMYFPSDREPLTIAGLIEKHHISLLSCTPTFLKLLLLSDAFKSYDLKGLKVINFGAERMNPAVLESVKQLLPNASFNQAFGTTESTNIRTLTKPQSDFFKPGIEEVDYKIIENLLYIKLPESFVCELTQQMNIFEGWYATGDVVEQDAEGYIRIVSRQLELINIGGEKVSPLEVEYVIAQMPEIAHVKVFAGKNILTGEFVVVQVVLTQPLASDDIKKRIRLHCKNYLAEYKIPQKIIIKDQLEFNARMKGI